MTTREYAREIVSHRLWLRWMYEHGKFNDWNRRGVHDERIPDVNAIVRRVRRQRQERALIGPQERGIVS